MSAPWSTVEALRNDPDFLAEVETAFAERDAEHAEREAIRSEGTGSVRGKAPHFTCQRADNWTNELPAQCSGVPRAVIPNWLDESERRESFDAGADGLVLRPRALHALPKIVLNAEGELERLGDGQGENQDQACELYGLGFASKAQRLSCCRRFGRRIECAGGHAFRQIFSCGLRFCKACAPRVFRELYEKHVRLEKLVARRRGWVLARLDFTLRNTGEMPNTEAIRAMNLAVRKVLRSLLRRKEGWGFLWCDEFGWQNTNLHCHGLYYGPWIPQERLVEAWLQETRDSRIVSIKSARWNFRRALQHLLKYVAKPAGNDPKHLARLEAAFSGVRRVHTLGLFYNPDLPEDDDSFREGNVDCPHCGGRLFVVGGYCAVSELESYGLVDIEAARREVNRQRAFGRASPL